MDLCGDLYKPLAILGEGSFGKLFLARNVKTRQKVALKVEEKSSFILPQLKHEYDLYRAMGPHDGLPVVYQYREEKEYSYNFMAIQWLGSNLEQLFNKCKRRFSLKTQLLVAIQLLKIIEYVHDNGIVHRDIKPENLVVGPFCNEESEIQINDINSFSQSKDELKAQLKSHRKQRREQRKKNKNKKKEKRKKGKSEEEEEEEEVEEQEQEHENEDENESETGEQKERDEENDAKSRADLSRIYLIDFGLARRFRVPSSGEHIVCRPRNKDLDGTARYSSATAHLGFDQTRRDDMESIVYMLIYFAKGRLPWQGLPEEDMNEKDQKISRIKNEMSINELCKGMEIEYAEFFECCRDLHSDEKPDYERLVQLLKSLAKRKHINLEPPWHYDWDGPVHSPVSNSLPIENDNENKVACDASITSTRSDATSCASENQNKSNEEEEEEEEDALSETLLTFQPVIKPIAHRFTKPLPNSFPNSFRKPVPKSDHHQFTSLPRAGYRARHYHYQFFNHH